MFSDFLAVVERVLIAGHDGQSAARLVEGGLNDPHDVQAITVADDELFDREVANDEDAIGQ